MLTYYDITNGRKAISNIVQFQKKIAQKKLKIGAP